MDITRETPASFEPTIDYVVTKIPRFAFETFPEADPTLTTQMKSVGEVMSIGRTFKEPLQKAIRSLEMDTYGLEEIKTEVQRIKAKLKTPNPERIWYIAQALREGFSVQELYEITRIDPWFLENIRQIIDMEEELQNSAVEEQQINTCPESGNPSPPTLEKRGKGGFEDEFIEVLKTAKRVGFSDRRIAQLLRGFGGPQGEFLAEMQMSKLAEKLGMDPIELRMKNVLREGSILSVGTPVPKGISMAEVLERCAIEAGWVKDNRQSWLPPAKVSNINPTKRYGLGLAIGYKNVGFSFGAVEQSVVRLELRGGAEIEEAIIYHAAAEVGQGTHTVMRQMTAEAVGLPLEKVRLVVSDTASSGGSGSISASRMTFMMRNSIRGAAELALKKWADR